MRWVEKLYEQYKAWLHKRKYTYGNIVSPTLTIYNARLINKSGRVEFILWKAGEHGHKEDYWHLMGTGWEEYFVLMEG